VALATAAVAAKRSPSLRARLLSFRTLCEKNVKRSATSDNAEDKTFSPYCLHFGARARAAFFALGFAAARERIFNAITSSATLNGGVN
jgi:hypothetical protein